MSPTVEQIEKLIENEPGEAIQALMVRDDLEMSGAKKAAILCLALGEEPAAAIFRHLEEDEVQKLSKELAVLQSVSSEDMNLVIQEFYQLLLARSYVSTGGVEYAKRLLIKSFGVEHAKRLTDKVLYTLESNANFETLQKVDPQQIAKLFQSEHPQTIAVVLAHLDASTAATTLQNLPENRRGEVAIRLANLQTVSQDVLRRVSQVLDQKLANLGNIQRTSLGGARSVADIFNRLDREIAKQMLEQIETANPDLSLEIRNSMLTFEDILLVDDIGIREILTKVDKKVLALALKGTLSELQDRFFSNMSSRAVEMMKEEMDFMGQVRMKDVVNAQRQIVDILRQLEEQGIVSISGGGENEYVS
jgi:flagellar motor switch protein FliG